MIIPLLTSSPWDLSFPTTLSLDLGIGSPRGRQSTPVKCPQEGEWKGKLHPVQPSGTIFPAQVPGRNRQGNCPVERQPKVWKEASRVRRSAGTKGKSWVKFWLDFSLLAAMASQEALKGAETETLLGRRHGAPQETPRSASATGAQSGNQLWPVRCHTSRVTFPNGVF